MKCPKCGEFGGSLTKRWVKAVVNVPKYDKINSVSDAWSYAAKVLLRNREMAILMPTQENSTLALTSGTFDMFCTFTGHSQTEIEDFESKFTNQIPRTVRNWKKYFNSKPKSSVITFADGTNEQKSDPIRLELPRDTLKISKFDISLLYGALVCLAISEIIKLSKINTDNETKDSIFTYFSIVHMDTRHAHTLAKYAQIYSDVEKYGFRAATRMNGVMSTICKNCFQIGKKSTKFDEMDIDDTSPTKMRCRRCQSTEGKMRYLTVKHLKKKETIVRKKFAHFYSKANILIKHMSYLVRMLKSDIDIRRLFLEKFEYYKSLALKDNLCLREHYFVGHYDNTKNWKRRWCSINSDNLSCIEINDR